MTANGRREENIRLIIGLEERIAQCKRCRSLLSCVRKPALGKGNLQPEIVLVLEHDSDLPEYKEKINEVRGIVKREFSNSKIYHTFMVRCQPKACSIRTNTSCYMENNKFINRELHCLLTNRRCEGVAIKPTDEHIISCLPFLIEELDIIEPRFIIMFGALASEFVLKSYGVFRPVATGDVVQSSNGALFVSVSNLYDFSAKQLKRAKEELEMSSKYHILR